ncbi:MAG: hypothetical protein SFV17_03075 [Candidatus Obscuribacter sp.]|nr:hypothetical protein [Candidatus Melainabacteria bacterium]MDX1985647.1 hypothetical protein [Candidatus Obscuribacter sp.]
MAKRIQLTESVTVSTQYAWLMNTENWHRAFPEAETIQPQENATYGFDGQQAQNSGDWTTILASPVFSSTDMMVPADDYTTVMGEGY